MELGTPHRHFRITDSTNARARELAGAGAPGGVVVTAAEQTAGRGRQGRTWTAPPDSALLYSAILRPLDERHLLLPLSAPLAVCETAEELEPGVECAIKWPNDVWVEERKLAGVLIEAKPQAGWAVIGVGLNLAIEPGEFPPELRESATSLRGGATAEEARRALDRQLSRWVDADRETILAAWRSRDALRGREISWDGGAGVADGIEDSGDLLVVAAGGDRVVLGAGEVHLRL
jgi:BirA family transcriptional regulator, biotin operon repressor / biotin---[acetyl-CoA-carboxylase] ligase